MYYGDDPVIFNQNLLGMTITLRDGYIRLILSLYT